MKTAILIGATGLVGSHILNQLLENRHYSKVIVFTRRTLNIQSKKLEEHCVDFNKMDAWKDLISGDDLFSAMGTTIKTAGSQEAQYLIDYTYPFRVAKFAKQNGIKSYALVSSGGANTKSNNFYSRMKGELDRDVTELNFEKTIIVRPSIIEGNRNESRVGETIGLKIMHVLKHVPGLSKYKPAAAELIASCMVKAMNDDFQKENCMFEWNRVMEYAQS